MTRSARDVRSSPPSMWRSLTCAKSTIASPIGRRRISLAVAGAAQVATAYHAREASRPEGAVDHATAQRLVTVDAGPARLRGAGGGRRRPRAPRGVAAGGRPRRPPPRPGGVGGRGGGPAGFPPPPAPGGGGQPVPGGVHGHPPRGGRP